MDICYIITIVIFVLLFVGYFVNNSEHFANDLESIANIASIYNTDKMKVTNLDVTQNINATSLNATSLNALSFNLLPKGIITLWSGQVDKISAGWVLCDGQNGTPDLRSRFIVGAGPDYNVGTTGGENTVTLTTDQLPAHNHTHNFYKQGLRVHGHYSQGQIMDSGKGIFNSSTNNTGKNQPHENRPPFYALAYIMKT
jgi:microcystin-dependent protein